MKNSTFLIIIVLVIGALAVVAALPDSDPVKLRINTIIYNVTGKDMTRGGDLAQKAATAASAAEPRQTATQPPPASQTQAASEYPPFDESRSSGSGTADKLIKKANAGDSSAQFSLGRIYAEANGVEQNLVTAYMWFNLARANGHAKAKDEVNRLMKEMDNRQIAEGQRLAALWWETYKK